MWDSPLLGKFQNSILVEVEERIIILNFRCLKQDQWWLFFKDSNSFQGDYYRSCSILQANQVISWHLTWLKPHPCLKQVFRDKDRIKLKRYEHRDRISSVLSCLLWLGTWLEISCCRNTFADISIVSFHDPTSNRRFVKRFFYSLKQTRGRWEKHRGGLHTQTRRYKCDRRMSLYSRFREHPVVPLMSRYIIGRRTSIWRPFQVVSSIYQKVSSSFVEWAACREAIVDLPKTFSKPQIPRSKSRENNEIPVPSILQKDAYIPLSSANGLQLLWIKEVSCTKLPSM